MASSHPFFDTATGGLDTDEILAEVFPLAGLIALFAGLALGPFLIALVVGGNSGLGVLFTIVAQLILAVGTGIVLMYVIARGIQLADT